MFRQKLWARHERRLRFVLDLNFVRLTIIPLFIFSMKIWNIWKSLPTWNLSVQIRTIPVLPANSQFTILNIFFPMDVDGILFAPTTNQVLPAICRMCEEAKVYWGIYLRSITDKEIEDFCKSSPYYIGNTYENEEDWAYQLAQSVLKKGYRKFAVYLKQNGIIPAV